MLQQRVDALPGLGRHGHEGRVTAERLGHDAVLQQLLLHLVRVRLVLVDLVDRHHQRHIGRLGVVDRLHRLGHDAVVRGHDQDDQVGHLGAARAHRRERLVARRIEERDDAARRLDVVGPDVLRDSPGLSRRDLGAADVVEERSLAMVDVAHDRHHGRARLGLHALVGSLRQVGLRIFELRRPRLVPHFLDDDHRRLLVEDLVDRGHGAELHQHLDHLGRLDRHPVRQLAHRDRLRDGDVAGHRLGGLAERRGFPDRRRAPMPHAAPAVPAPYAAAHVAARLDRATAHRIVAHRRGRLGLLGLLVGFRVSRLRRMQRALDDSARRLRLGFLDRHLRFALCGALLGLAALALLLPLQLRRLQRRELLVPPRFVLAQRALALVDRRRRRRRAGDRSRRRERDRRRCRCRRLHRAALRSQLRRVALHEHALLAHLDLDRARLARGVGLLDDLAALLARERDLVLRFHRAMGLAQVFQQPCLVALAQRILGSVLVDAGRAKLLEQHRGRHLQLARELRDARRGHVTGPP